MTFSHSKAAIKDLQHKVGYFVASLVNGLTVISQLQDTRSRIAVLVESNHKLKEGSALLGPPPAGAEGTAETSRRQNIESHNSSEIQHLRSSLSSAKSQVLLEP